MDQQTQIPGRQAADHLVEVPGGTLYYRTQGRGPVLVLSCGGPGNADTLQPLAASLAGDYTVVTYDRRGYSRSHVDDDPAEPVSISRHSDDLRRLINDLGTGPVSVFGTSFGALIALDLAATAPGIIAKLILHEPPFGQLLADGERQSFDLNLNAAPDPRAALNAIATSIGVKRGLAGEGMAGRAGSGPDDQPGSGAAGAGPRPADVELFIRRDAPAIGEYHLDLKQLDGAAGRITVTGSEEGRGFYPHHCAQRLASYLGTALIELPGNHAGMIRHPQEFADRLRTLLQR